MLLPCRTDGGLAIQPVDVQLYLIRRRPIRRDGALLRMAHTVNVPQRMTRDSSSTKSVVRRTGRPCRCVRSTAKRQRCAGCGASRPRARSSRRPLGGRSRGAHAVTAPVRWLPSDSGAQDATLPFSWLMLRLLCVPAMWYLPHSAMQHMVKFSPSASFLQAADRLSARCSCGTKHLATATHQIFGCHVAPRRAPETQQLRLW